MSGPSSLGAYLRDLRGRRGLSLDELARLTRVASRYLEALETDEFTSLPAPVFTRGYIRAYCQALHEPVEEALALYQAQSGRALPATPARSGGAPPPAESEARSRSTVLVSFVLLVVLGLALFGVTLALQSGREMTGKRTVADSSAAPSLSPSSAPVEARSNVASEAPLLPVPPAAEVVAATRAVLPPSAASASTAPATPPPSASPPASTSPPSAPDLAGVVAAVTSPYRLVARVSEPTWIRVRTDDGRLTEETIPAGQVREWVSNGPFVLTIGNAGGVSFELNGRLLPALGPSGAVISRLVLPPQQ